MECIRIRHISLCFCRAGKVRIKTPDGKVEVHSDVPLGAVFWSNAETHEVENISGSNIRLLLIELKNARG